MNRGMHWLTAALIAASTGGLARAQTTVRASIDSNGAQGNGASVASSISADGRFVAFTSAATNLVAGDTNGVVDVFVHDRRSGATERVSVDSAGAQATFDCNFPAISADGRWVVFESFSANLVAGDTNAAVDVFVHDRQLGTTERVGVGAGGAEGNAPSFDPRISADGRFVAFVSYASNLVAGDTNAAVDAFVRDRLTGTTERVSVDCGGLQSNGDSFNPAVTPDGRFVAFYSYAANLVAGDTNGQRDVFVRDRQTGTTERVSVDSGGAQGNFGSIYPSISADGRFVAFHSEASNLVAGDTNTREDVFVRDRLTTTTVRVSVATGGAEGNGTSTGASITADGRSVAFQSFATNLVAADTNGTMDVFVHDRLTGTTERASLAASGAQSAANNFAPSISATGRFVTFESLGADLVAGDTNGFTDVFVRDRRGAPPTAFCSGDGSGTACPCGNPGGVGRGCANAANANGSLLVGGGSTSLAGDALVLTASGMPDASALFVQGTSPENGGLGSVFGDGLRCAGGRIVRLGTKQNVAGASQYPSGMDAPVSVAGLVTSPGTRVYQVWYRNAVPYCTTATFNLTNGVQATWTP